VPVIAFFGPDGAGKTTQADLLVDYLRTKNFKTRKAWIRAVHGYAFAISKVLIRMGYVKKDPVGPGSIPMRLDLEKSPPLQAVWPWVELLSLLPLVISRVKLPSLLGRTVVCERYTIDSIPSISYTVGDASFDRRFLAKALLSMVSEGYVLVNLDCDYDSIVSRRGAQAEPEDFIKIQREMYAKFQPRLGALYLNTATITPTETQDRIRQFVGTKLHLS
jgi:thymidylate kinase